MAQFPFGNDPAKIEKYLAFWNRDDDTRPLVGFSFVGWFPKEMENELTFGMIIHGEEDEDHL